MHGGEGPARPVEVLLFGGYLGVTLTDVVSSRVGRHFRRAHRSTRTEQAGQRAGGPSDPRLATPIKRCSDAQIAPDISGALYA